jgi:nucleoside-diphosphate-sugar epimerase
MALALVTGAAGRLGSLVCSALLSEGYLVRGLVKPGSSAALAPGVERLEFDLSRGPLPAFAFQGAKAVAHCAGLVGERPYAELVLHNSFAVKNLLENCPGSVERVALASSISVYGGYPGKTVDESFEPKPDTPYGRSKLLGETFAREYLGSLNISVLRLGMLYGPAFTEGYYQVLDYLSAGKMRLLGSGANRLPLLHQVDAVSAVLAALQSRATGCREYNIVGTEQRTQKELLGIAAAKLGAAAPSDSTPVLFAHAGVVARTALSSLGLGKPPSISGENIRQLSLDRAYSVQRAREELGFEAKVKLEDGLNDVVQIYLAARRGQK